MANRWLVQWALRFVQCYRDPSLLQSNRFLHSQCQTSSEGIHGEGEGAGKLVISTKYMPEASFRQPLLSLPLRARTDMTTRWWSARSRRRRLYRRQYTAFLYDNARPIIGSAAIEQPHFISSVRGLSPKHFENCTVSVFLVVYRISRFHCGYRPNSLRALKGQYKGMELRPLTGEIIAAATLMSGASFDFGAYLREERAIVS